MCLDRSFETGFSLIILQLRLSSYRGVGVVCAAPASASTLRRYKMSSDALLAATYSASDVDVATLFCCLHFQKSAPQLSVLTYPDVDLQVAVHAAQSASAQDSSQLALAIPRE